MRTILSLALLIVIFGFVASHPTRYDQRQDGDLNVHAHLENIVLVYVTKSSDFGMNLLKLAIKQAANKNDHESEEDDDSRTANVIIADSPEDAIKVEFKPLEDPKKEKNESQSNADKSTDIEEQEKTPTTTPIMATLPKDKHEDKEGTKDSSPAEVSTDKPSKEETSNDKSSEESNSDDKSSKEKDSKDKSSEEKDSKEKSSEEKKSSDKSSEEKTKDKSSEEKTSPEKFSEGESSTEKSSDEGPLKKEEDPQKKPKEARVLNQTDGKGVLKLKQILAEGVEPCFQVTEQGLCLPVTREAKQRIERQQRQRLIDIISTGLAPADY